MRASSSSREIARASISCSLRLLKVRISPPKQRRGHSTDTRPARNVNTPRRSRPCAPPSRRAACPSSGRSGCPGSRRRWSARASTWWPRRVSSSTTASGMPVSGRTRAAAWVCRAGPSASPSRRARTRGASPASCTFMPKSIRLTSTCTCPCGCMSPPMTPKTNHGLPSFVTSAGMMVWNGRLCGSRRLGCLSSRANSVPRFCRAKPRSPGTRPEPKPM